VIATTTIGLVSLLWHRRFWEETILQGERELRESTIA